MVHEIFPLGSNSGASSGLTPHFAFDQKKSQPFLHGSDQPPGLAIGHSHLFRRAMERMSLVNPLQEFTRTVSKGFSLVVQPDFIANAHGFLPSSLFSVQDNATIMNPLESVKNLNDLRRDVLFVKIVEV